MGRDSFDSGLLCFVGAIGAPTHAVRWFCVRSVFDNVRAPFRPNTSHDHSRLTKKRLHIVLLDA